LTATGKYKQIVYNFHLKVSVFKRTVQLLELLCLHIIFYNLGVFVTMAWCILGLQMEDMASRYRGYLQTYWISSYGQPIKGGSPAWGLDEGLTTPHCKKNLLWNATDSCEHCDNLQVP